MVSSHSMVSRLPLQSGLFDFFLYVVSPPEFKVPMCAVEAPVAPYSQFLMQQHLKQYSEGTDLLYCSAVRTLESHESFLLGVQSMQYVSPPSLLTAPEPILQMFSAISPSMFGIKWLCSQVPHTFNSLICFISRFSLCMKNRSWSW